MHVEIRESSQLKCGQSPVYAFVNLGTAAEAADAIQALSGKRLLRCKVNVGLAHYRTPMAGSEYSSAFTPIAPITKLPAPRFAPEGPFITATMPPTVQHPLPSLEFSPPVTPITPFSTKKQQSMIQSDSEVDDPILKPGMVLSFPAKRQVPLFTNNSSTQIPVAPIRSNTPISIASDTTSSSFGNSAGGQLKADLAEHVQQLDLRPEDSVSNINVAMTPVVVKHESGFAVPNTPKSKFAVLSAGGC
jgi:hypothetical protein